MHLYRPVLQIAIISACCGTASELAERLNRRGQFAHVFADAQTLCAFEQLPTLDVILIDRREDGFAMTLSALRTFVRGASCYAAFCGFGVARSIVPAGLDYAYCSIPSDREFAGLLDEVRHALDGDVLDRGLQYGAGQLMC